MVRPMPWPPWLASRPYPAAAGGRGDRVPDVAERVAGPHRGDARRQRRVRRLDQRGVLRAWRSHDEAARRVAAPAAQRRAEVDGHQVAVGEHLAVGDAVHDGVVDR